MAKSIRSKVKRRFRTAKRGVVKRTVTDDRSKPILKKLARAAEGVLEVDVKPRNAFRSDAADAVFPQHSFTPCTDFRSANVVEARYATSGNRRETHPINKLAADAEEVLTFGAAPADSEELPVASEPPPFEDDRMNYDGTTKCSSRQRRRARNKSGPQPGSEKAGYSFWGNKSGKMGMR